MIMIILFFVLIDGCASIVTKVFFLVGIYLLHRVVVAGISLIGVQMRSISLAAIHSSLHHFSVVIYCRRRRCCRSSSLLCIVDLSQETKKNMMPGIYSTYVPNQKEWCLI
jgi:hypothetical protein